MRVCVCLCVCAVLHVHTPTRFARVWHVRCIGMSTLIPPLSVSDRPLPTRVVVRLLPPIITKNEFVDAIGSTNCDLTFVPGRRTNIPSPETPNLNARSYLKFETFALASDFIQRFHGHVFLDDKGESFRAVAAFAPSQRAGKRRIFNALQNTIEKDSHYLNFSNGTIPPAPSPTKLDTNEPYISPLVKSLTERPQSARSVRSTVSPTKVVVGHVKSQTPKFVKSQTKQNNNPQAPQIQPPATSAVQPGKKVTVLKRK